MSRSVLNDNFNRKHGEILDTAEKIQNVSISFNLFEYVPIMSDDVINSKHGEILDTAEKIQFVSICFNLI